MKSSAIADTFIRGKDPQAGEAGRQARRAAQAPPATKPEPRLQAGKRAPAALPAEPATPARDVA